MVKLWGGRFTGETDQLVEKFNESFHFDKKLYNYDIKGSKIHTEMLAFCGIISEDEKEKIIAGLTAVENDIEEKGFTKSAGDEDIHTYVERNLIKKIGPTGGKLHTARSRNDQVALDMRLYMRTEVRNIMELVSYLLMAIIKLSKKHNNTIMPGYTHLQRAQPITFGHYLLAYYFKFKRDYSRFKDNLKRINILPLGSGALAGTSFAIDREWVAEKLGFKEVCQNSLDGVSDRDYLIEFLSNASTFMMHVSRLSEELILWSSSDFNFIELSDSYTTGSSIMPQKKNPDVAELIRGKTGRVYGNLMQLLTVMKGLPLAYNKDMQEDKEGIFNTVETLEIILKILPGMLETMKVKNDKMYRAAETGYTNATELANHLVQEGLSFRESHEIVGKAVLYALDKNKELHEMSITEWHKLFPELKEKFSEDIYDKLNIKECVKNANSTGGPAPEETLRIVKTELEWIENQ